MGVDHKVEKLTSGRLSALVHPVCGTPKLARGESNTRSQLTAREHGVLVRAPDSGHENSLGTLDDVAGARASDGGEAEATVLERRRLLPLHRCRDGSDPAGVRVNDGGSDGRAFEKAELRSRLGGEALANGLASGEDEARRPRDAADLLEVRGDLRRRGQRGTLNSNTVY